MSKRMTKGEFQESLGASIRSATPCWRSPTTTSPPRRRRPCSRPASPTQDILTYTSAELFPNLDEMMRHASGAAGFGYEITLMRRYMTLAGEGCGWLVVYAPDEKHTAQVTEVAKRFNAKSAVHYGRLLHEDLI